MAAHDKACIADVDAADVAGMRPLVELASRALARMIEGRTPEEIRDNPRIRLLNRLNQDATEDLSSELIRLAY